MKIDKRLLPFLFLLSLFVCVPSGAKVKKTVIKPHESQAWLADVKPTATLKLYPNGQQSDRGIALGPGEENGYEGSWVEYSFHQYTRIADPFIELYIPEKCNGQMVVICPGGGYRRVCANHEGMQAALWLNKRGIAACVLIYRTPNGHHKVPLTDVQNAILYCRANAGKWGVSQIGVMGFSAGGHLAASASTLYYDAQTRPDFSILFYPVITCRKFQHKGSFKNLIVGESAPASQIDNPEYAELCEHYSLEDRVKKDTPKTIIFFSCNDPLPIGNSLVYYQSLVNNGISCEIHSMSSGKHGWGFGTREGQPDPLTPEQRAELENTLSRWLNDRVAEMK